MEVNRQLHAPAALSPRKGRRYPLDRGLGGPECYKSRPPHPDLITLTNLVKRTNYITPHYAIFSSLLLHPPCQVQIFSSAPCSQPLAATFKRHLWLCFN